jgi:ribose-phosphate pyrophosphokinase
MMIFSGSSNPALAEKVSQAASIPIGEVELSRFANDEARVWIQNERVDREVALIQSLSRPTDQHLVEFTLMADALKRIGVREITAVIPWLGYSKQDKVFRPGEPLSVKIIAQILQTVRLERVITFDLHNLAILGFFEVPVVNLSSKQLFIDFFKSRIDERTVVVAPDAGAVKNSTAFAYELGLDVAYINKKRDLVTGDVFIQGINRDIADHRVIIVDDMIVTGSTLIEVAAFLKAHGARSVEVAATHHLYVPGVQEKLDGSEVDLLVVTDTIKPQATSAKLQVLSVAGLIRQELMRGQG